MTLRFTIPGASIDLNTYINAERTHRMKAAALKQQETDRITWLLPKQKLEGRIDVTIQAFQKDRRKDPDNVYFFTKFLFDAMKAKGMIDNDGQKTIGRITLEPVELGDPRFEVTVQYL